MATVCHVSLRYVLVVKRGAMGVYINTFGLNRRYIATLSFENVKLSIKPMRKTSKSLRTT